MTGRKVAVLGIPVNSKLSGRSNYSVRAAFLLAFEEDVYMNLFGARFAKFGMGADILK